MAKMSEARGYLMFKDKTLNILRWWGMLADDVETSGACGWTLAIRPLAWLARSALQKIATLLKQQLNCCRWPFGQKQRQALQWEDGIFRKRNRSRNKACNEEMASSGLRETVVPLSFTPSSSRLLIKLKRLASNYYSNNFAQQSMPCTYR